MNKYFTKKIKHCQHCKSTKTEELHINSTNKKGRIFYICRKCDTDRMKKYRKTESGKESVRRAVAKYEKNNPRRRNAWTQAQKIKKKKCEICGNKNTHKHHPDVNKPLEVVFLCPYHHKQIHKLIK